MFGTDREHLTRLVGAILLMAVVIAGSLLAFGDGGDESPLVEDGTPVTYGDPGDGPPKEQCLPTDGPYPRPVPAGCLPTAGVMP